MELDRLNTGQAHAAPVIPPGVCIADLESDYVP